MDPTAIDALLATLMAMAKAQGGQVLVTPAVAALIAAAAGTVPEDDEA